MVEKEEGREPAEQALQKLLERARVDGDVEVVVSDESFTRILHEHSADATCVILGFELPEKRHEAEWHDNYRSFVDEMPTTILVNSLGTTEDLFA
ncbi:hypothetical protein ACFLYW_04285 [Thermodesulfobacteriota bacterium]